MDLKGAIDSPESWNDLFGVGGVLAKGRTVEVGSFVRELRLDELLKLRSQGPKHLHVSQLALHRCSSLTVTIVVDEIFPGVAKIVSQLPLTNVMFFYDINHPRLPNSPDSTYSARLSDHVGLHPQPLAWRNLERLTMRNVLWCDPIETSRRRLSFSDWSFKVLVFEAEPSFTGGAEKAFALFTEPLAEYEEWPHGGGESESEREGEGFLPNVERIEFRIGGGRAKEIEQKFRDDATRRRAGGLNEVETRLLPKMVFVREDGKERRILEE